jgi:hypothetical protein
MRFEGISCDECRKTISIPEFQIAVYTDEAGKVRSIEAARDILLYSLPDGCVVFDICGCHCLQKSLMRLMEKLQVESANGKHAEAAEPAGGKA